METTPVDRIKAALVAQKKERGRAAKIATEMQARGELPDGHVVQDHVKLVAGDVVELCKDKDDSTAQALFKGSSAVPPITAVYLQVEDVYYVLDL